MLDEDFLAQGHSLKNSDKNHQTREKVGNFLGSFLSVPQAAKKLRVDPKTIKRWCESGKLPAMAKPYGKTMTYQISPQALEWLVSQQLEEQEEKAQQKKQAKPHHDYFQAWQKAMARGLIKGRAFSPATMKTYSFYTEPFIQRYKTLSLETLQLALLKIPPQHFAKRLKVYEALICFGRFLCSQGMLEESFLEEVKPLRPKRHIPPKRSVVSEDGLGKMLEACKTTQERLVVILLSSTGLRASEACALTWGDIDLDKGFLVVQCGKGGKRRLIGINEQLAKVFFIHKAEVKECQAHQRVLLNREGEPMSRYGLRDRLKRTGKRAGIEAVPHALRRAFVTINANKGRPLQMLQMACGHSDIKTTMGYCRTQEQEVIEAMKGWD